MRIPQIIHYCWFGRNPLPEDNFDVNVIPYTRETYEAKKYAFVSDYARMWILYHHGGLYFDTDVEVIKPIEDFLRAGDYAGFELWCKWH